MFVPYERAPLGELFIDVSIGFLVAIGCPMLVVVYCLSAFTFDRTKFAINMEVYPSGWFEQDASVNADPVQVAVIYKSLKSLRIMTALECLARVGVNVMFSFRLRYVVEIIRSPKRLRSSAYPKRHRLGAIGLVLYAIILVIFVEESMRTSTMACHPHPECAVNAHRWTILKSNSLTQCPCLMLIDQDIAPKTFAEWIMPMNVTEKVAQLATTGDLEMLQLTNRYLGELPVELRHCKNLRHLSLEYTNTQTFPPWVEEFTKLEFLHVESKVSSPMVLLPDDMFDDMPSLTFIHLAMCISMPKLPSLQGLSGLKSLTLAVFLALQEIPPLTNLHKLERFVFAGLVSIDSIPDLAPVRNLKSFVVSDRGTWCCNGFLGDCDLTNDKCLVHPVWGTPAATCLPSNRTEKRATLATLELVKKFAGTVCGPVLQPGALEGPPTPDIMAPCNGTMYRQCPRADKIESMCYNARFMGIACTTNPFPIKMRRRR
ncbi:hypothetical protein ON010_g10804 [Phytophthora cinnamomi]|nr:hypothetical protein ON010_g10804 [Phytophthora cinnamomi]